MANLLMWQVQVTSHCVKRLLLAVCLSHTCQNGIKSGLSDCMKKKAHQHREDVLLASHIPNIFVTLTLPWLHYLCKALVTSSADTCFALISSPSECLSPSQLLHKHIHTTLMAFVAPPHPMIRHALCYSRPNVSYNYFPTLVMPPMYILSMLQMSFQHL